MKSIVLPKPDGHPLPFYLAVEEWIVHNAPADEYFFAWQVAPTVICGRHQQMELEVDMDFCRERGIEVWRRRSGGGSVYADCHNIMFSYITPSTGVNPTFEKYTSMVCRMLASLGLNAKPTGRNDVEINGMKVAGNAFYSLPGRSIVHGTMLYDADFETMSRALTPSRAKLASKGVKSVPARITTLKAQNIGISLDQFIDHTLSNLCNYTYRLDEKAVAEVERIAAGYAETEFRYGRSAKNSFSSQCRIEGVGELRFSCNHDNAGRIINPRLSGDFFPLADVQIELCRRLDGLPAERQALAESLRHIDVPNIIAGLETDRLLDIILESNH